MENLITNIRNLLKDYPDYGEVEFDENKNIIVKKKSIKNYKNRDTITEIIKKLIREDMK